MSSGPSPALVRAQSLVDWGHALRDAGDLAAAAAAFNEAASLAPDHPNPLHNLATVQHLLGDLTAAEANLRRALALAPDRAVTRSALGAVLLTQGRFAEGFPLYDAWRDIPEREHLAAPKLPFRRWRGEPLAGARFLVWSEEGYGDQIMYARFVARLRDEGAQVSWLCPVELARLFQRGLGIEVFPSDQSVDLVGFDFYCPSSALAAVMMPKLGQPPPAPYLAAPTPTAPTGARIGLACRGNPEHRADAARSLPDELAAELLSIEGAISLHPEDTGAADFEDAAAIIAGLDLVISVDSAVAHLAGALGKPVWILLREPAAEWRWGQGREDSPWYPTARLFRQQTQGDWASVVALVKKAVRDL